MEETEIDNLISIVKNHPLVQYTKIFNGNYKIEFLEEWFTQRYADDTFIVSDEKIGEVYWERTVLILLSFFCLFSILVKDQPDASIIYFTNWSLHFTNLALITSQWAMRYP